MRTVNPQLRVLRRLAPLVIALCCVSGVAFGQVLNFEFPIDASQEVPPNGSPATGVGLVQLDLATLQLSWNITFSGLLGAQTAAHFHGPAPECENAGIVIGLPLGSPIVGSQMVTEAAAQEILDGRWYVNVHSNMHPGGEIRGQVE